MNHRLKCSSSQVCDQAGRRLGAQHGRSRRLRSRVRSLDRCRPIASANRFYWVPGRRSASLRATTDSHGVLGLRPLQSHSRISSRLNPHPLIHMLTARAAPQTQPPHGERPLRECRVQQRNVLGLIFGPIVDRRSRWDRNTQRLTRCSRCLDLCWKLFTRKMLSLRNRLGFHKPLLDAACMIALN